MTTHLSLFHTLLLLASEATRLYQHQTDCIHINNGLLSSIDLGSSQTHLAIRQQPRKKNNIYISIGLCALDGWHQYFNWHLSQSPYHQPFDGPFLFVCRILYSQKEIKYISNSQNASTAYGCHMLNEYAYIWMICCLISATGFDVLCD